MKRRVIWSGWQVQHMDEAVRPAPVKLKKTTRSVAVYNLTPQLGKDLLPHLQQVEWLQLQEGVDPEAIPLLASLPKLTGIDLPAFRDAGADPERHAAVVRAVCALPNLKSLFAVGLPGRLIPLLAGAQGLQWLALWSPRGVEAGHLAPLGGLQHLEELQLLGKGVRPDVPLIDASAFERLAAGGGLRDIHILDSNLDQGAVNTLLGAKGLQRATLQFPYTRGKEIDVRVTDRADLELVELTMPGGAGEFARLPKLRDLNLYGFIDLIVDEVPELRAIDLYSAGKVRLRNLPSLRKLTVGIGPDELEVSGTERLAKVDMKDASLGDESKAALRTTLPRATLVLERPTFAKRKRTAEKRRLTAKEWKHPRLGVESMAYAAVVVGRAYEQDLAVAKGTELATIAEVWSTERKEHLVAVMPFDLTKESGALSSSDEVSPVVIGRVASLVSADDGPSSPIDVEKLKGLLMEPLPAEFWAEVAGVIGNDAVEQARDAVFLVAAGPLAEARLAFGELKSVESVPAQALIRGQRFDQTPHERGVAGELIEATEEAIAIDLDELPGGPGGLHLICRYD